MIGIREALGVILATTNSPKPPGIFATRQILKKGGNGQLNIPRLELSVVWICDKIICDKIITNRGICKSGNILDGNDFDHHDYKTWLKRTELASSSKQIIPGFHQISPTMPIYVILLASI